MSEDEEYKMQVACKQVYTVLSFYNQDLLNLKVPKEVVDNLKSNSAKDYEYNIDINSFDPNTLTEEACDLLWVIFEEYFGFKDKKEMIDILEGMK